MIDRIVIVGGGHAGAQAAVSLRQRGFDRELVLVSGEAEMPYQRPPLSKKFLTGGLTDVQILLKAGAWYRENGIGLQLGRTAVDVDLDAARVLLEDGEAFAYDRLLLATGSRLRRLQVPGADLAGVHYLRTVADARALHRTLTAAKRVAVIGGGYIGLEVAASAREFGAAVCVLEREARLLCRVASPELAQAVRRLHAAAGVEVRCGAQVAALAGRDGAVERVLLADGEALEADAVVIGIGVEPETALAEEAGLRVDDGIVVDEYCQTSNPLVYAAGDCTSHPDRFLRRRVRLESVPNATQQGRTAAASMLGELAPYADAPWFWSEQYGLRLQTAGLPDDDYETVLRGDPAGDSFALFHLDGGRLKCVEAMNRMQEFLLGRRLIEAEAEVDDTLAEDQTPFRTIAEHYLGDAL